MISVEYTITDLNQLIYNFAFDYLKKKYVKVSSKNTTTGVVTNYTYGVHYVVVDKTIELLQSVGAVGDVLRIVRETSTSEQIVSWNDASILKASDMSLAQLQQLHILEEYGEYIDMYSLTVAIDGQYDAKHSRIINLLDPQTATDAVTKGYVDSMLGTITSSHAIDVASILSALGNKVDKEAGKGLSSNDYTDTDKSKIHDHTNTSVLDKIGESLSGVLTYNGMEVSNGSGGSGDTTDHNLLINRSADNQHTINAIQGLQTELDKKVSVTIGKGLSSNDYDNNAKSKVDNLSVTKAVDLDTIESASHTHTNTTVLGKIGESLSGFLTYNGMEVSSGSGGSGGTTDHNSLINRSADNQHTINAIQGLQTELDKKVSVTIGKGLSSNDYDNNAKSKVDNLSVTQAVDLDAIESASHTHLNSSVLGKIGEDANGNILYNNNRVNDKLANARTIALSGKVIGTATSFDGSSNIAIPVTSVVADSCTGNSATATKLNTPVSINGVPFDGSANIEIPTGGGGSGATNKYIYTTNNTFTVTTAGTYNITAVAGGGGGTSCMGCGGGSGQSTSGYAVTLGVGDTISFTIGMGGSGSKVVGESVSLPSSGGSYAGANGGNTVINITKSGLPAPSQTITLTGGGGGSCPTPSSIQYKAGIGENNGGTKVMNMFNNSTGHTAWTGGNGGNSIFGSGGSGGTITYNGFQKIPAKNAIAYGAGGGGGGFLQSGSSGTYYWTAGGDGMQGCVIIEVA